jgi:hypothetical protein
MDAGSNSPISWAGDPSQIRPGEFLPFAQGRLTLQMAVLAYGRVSFNHRIRPDADMIFQRNAAEVQLAAFNPCIFEIDRIADADAIANLQQIMSA